MKKTIGKRIFGMVLVLLALAIIGVSFMGASCGENLAAGLLRWSCVSSGCFKMVSIPGQGEQMQCSQRPSC